MEANNNEYIYIVQQSSDAIDAKDMIGANFKKRVA